MLLVSVKTTDIIPSKIYWNLTTFNSVFIDFLIFSGIPNNIIKKLSNLQSNYRTQNAESYRTVKSLELNSQKDQIQILASSASD